MSTARIYRISFYNQNTIYELYAKQVFQCDMFGFLEVREFVFGNTTGVLVDPAEERLKSEFSGVKSTYIPLHSVIRVDEVEKEGTAKIRECSKGTGNVTPFPIPVYTPAGTPSGN